MNSEDRDRTEQLSDSETPYSVSSRTKSKKKSGRRVSHGAAEHCEEEETEYRDDDGYTMCPVAQGDRATQLYELQVCSLNFCSSVQTCEMEIYC